MELGIVSWVLVLLTTELNSDYVEKRIWHSVTFIFLQATNPLRLKQHTFGPSLTQKRFRAAAHAGPLKESIRQGGEVKLLLLHNNERTSFLSRGRQVLRSRAKSQWIAVWWLLYHLQHPGRYLSRLQTDWLTHNAASVWMVWQRDPTQDA